MWGVDVEGVGVRCMAGIVHARNTNFGWGLHLDNSRCSAFAVVAAGSAMRHPVGG
jgi:hypothetical protein